MEESKYQESPTLKRVRSRSQFSGSSGGAGGGRIKDIKEPRGREGRLPHQQEQSSPGSALRDRSDSVKHRGRSRPAVSVDAKAKRSQTWRPVDLSNQRLQRNLDEPPRPYQRSITPRNGKDQIVADKSPHRASVASVSGISVTGLNP